MTCAGCGDPVSDMPFTINAKRIVLDPTKIFCPKCRAKRISAGRERTRLSRAMDRAVIGEKPGGRKP